MSGQSDQATGTLVCVGWSHRTADLGLRERLSLTHAGRRQALDSLVHPRRGGFEEAVLLQTCNRTEYYLVAENDGNAAPIEAALVRLLAEFHGLSHRQAQDLAEHAYRHADEAAVRHVMRVAAGLDSMLLGEYQILGQVRDAGREAAGAAAAGRRLEALFETAVRVGRRARSETEIGRRAASVPSAAVALAREVRGELEGGVVVVVGAGKMGMLTAKHLVSAGVHSVVVSNRSYDRARQLAEEWGGCAVTFDGLESAIAQADVIIASTGAPHAIVRRDIVARAMAERPERPLVIVDIAVPRDVEPEVATVPGVVLKDLDDLQTVVETSLSERSEAIPAVEAIVDEEAGRYLTWLAALAVEPTIAHLHQWAEGVRQEELDRALRRLNGLGDRDVEIVKALSVAIVGKLLHPPMANLKDRAGSRASLKYADAVRELFDLDDGHA